MCIPGCSAANTHTNTAPYGEGGLHGGRSCEANMFLLLPVQPRHSLNQQYSRYYTEGSFISLYKHKRYDISFVVFFIRPSLVILIPSNCS